MLSHLTHSEEAGEGLGLAGLWHTGTQLSSSASPLPGEAGAEAHVPPGVTWSCLSAKAGEEFLQREMELTAGGCVWFGIEMRVEQECLDMT